MPPHARKTAAGGTFVVIRLDRLARSVSHLLTVIEQLAAKGGLFQPNVQHRS
jgi:DNA invertase Pin-like site-specific DNA recombinase